MHIKKNKINRILLTFLFFCIAGSTHLRSQYLLDEEEPKAETKKEAVRKEQKASGALEKRKVTIQKKQPRKEPVKKTIEIEKPALVEKKESPVRREPMTVTYDDVDEILKRTFLKGLYEQGIKELQNFISNSDNKIEISKARLFIARSYIELNEYSRALDILISVDVRKHYPREANFWEEFALLHLKNH